ncbi:MAG: riboflavin biosynthesis protein RibF [Phycisphaerae bacterium]|nr:riboflavin biosynthesis protein RibF [Phycisphaerae bacterium]
MQILEGLDGLRRLPAGAVMSIGNFDGVHLGHRHLLRVAREICNRTAGSRIAVVTFEPHPLTVLRPSAAPPRLTPPAVKRAALAEAGVDDLVILPPGRQVLDLTAEDFWAIVRDETRPIHLIEGPDFTFGKNRAGNIDRLREWTTNSDIKLHVIDPIRVPLLNLQVVPVSSSLIRWLILHGRVRDAAICLGRAYVLVGKVVEGFRRGRTIGVPTANLDVPDQLIPADGVYVGRCKIDNHVHAAAISIGKAPTFEGEPRRQIEAHLINFDGDLYGRTMELELLDWMRDQVRFAGMDALKQQLSRDIDRAGKLSTVRNPERAIAAYS